MALSAQVRMYSSVVPDPEVDWVQAGELDVDVANVGLESAGSEPEAMAIELGYWACPDTWVSFSHTTLYVLVAPS